jgi:hypothetical protein
VKVLASEQFTHAGKGLGRGVVEIDNASAGGKKSGELTFVAYATTSKMKLLRRILIPTRQRTLGAKSEGGQAGIRERWKLNG